MIEQEKEKHKNVSGYDTKMLFAPGTSPSQRKRFMAKIRSPFRVICIIRKVATWNPINTGQSYWATLRKAHIYNNKTPRDDMHNSPDYTFCVDTESVGSVKEAKELGREYAKKLGLRIARYDERL